RLRYDAQQRVCAQAGDDPPPEDLLLVEYRNVDRMHPTAPRVARPAIRAAGIRSTPSGGVPQRALSKGKAARRSAPQPLAGVGRFPRFGPSSTASRSGCKGLRRVLLGHFGSVFRIGLDDL